MKSEQPAPPAGGTTDLSRVQRNVEAVVAQYIQDLTRARYRA
jgi:hypothetical protein